MADRLREDALEYHRRPMPGKLAVAPTKPLANQRDLALAYSPGVAEACLEIVRRPERGRPPHGARQPGRAWSPTAPPCWASAPSAPLAAKPVMEGKAVLFKKFAGIDVFDIEVDESDPDKLVDDRRGARAHLRRHQPRGHQGAGMLRGRARAARADADPRLPRRPARHGDHRRGARSSTGSSGRQAARGGEARRSRRRGGGARLPRPAGRAWASGARTSASPTSSAWSTRAAPSRWTRTRRATPGDRRPHARRRASPAPTSSSASRPPAC